MYCQANGVTVHLLSAMGVTVHVLSAIKVTVHVLSAMEVTILSNNSWHTSLWSFKKIFNCNSVFFNNDNYFHSGALGC